MLVSGSNFKEVPAGSYPARCVRVIGLGTHHEEYNGKPKTRTQVLVSWELPTELIEDGDHAGEPYMLSKFYTASIGEKATLRKDLISWRGRDFTPEELKGFQLGNILGKVCLLTVSHSDKGKAKVSAVSAMPKGLTCPPQVNPTVHFDIYQFDNDVFNGLTDGIKGIIKKSDEYLAMFGLSGSGPVVHSSGEGSAVGEEDIPF